MSDFYVSLPSKGEISMATFPNNTQASYTTLLPKNVQMNGLYKEGLAEISFTNSVTVSLGFITIKQDVIFESFSSAFGVKKIEIFSDDCVSLVSVITKINSDITKYYKEFYEKYKINNLDFEDVRNENMPVIKFVSLPDPQITIDMPRQTCLIFDERP